MQKKIIVMAIAAALTTPALAMAEASIYGAVDASYDFVTTGDPVPSSPATKGTSVQRVSSNQSYLGVKGSEDLGAGLSMVWQVEGTLNFMGSGFSLDRNSYGGLSSSTLGTLVVGRIDSPYKTSTRNLDVFANSIADNRSLMGGKGFDAANLATLLSASAPTFSQTGTASSIVSFDGRNSQSLAYISPNWSGFSFQAGLVNLTANTNKLDTETKASALSLAGMYNVAPLYVAVAWEQHKIDYKTFTDFTETAMKFGVGYTMDAFSAGLVYEHTSDDLGTWLGASSSNFLGHNSWSVNGKFNVTPSDAVKAAYTHVGNLGYSTDSSAKEFSLGYDHSMSKSTTVYAIYTKLNNDKNTAYGLFGGGSYNGVSWIGTPYFGGGIVGANPSALSVGVKHSF